MFIDEEREGGALAHSKTLALASRCEWLQVVLTQQDQILAIADGLAKCCNTPTWAQAAVRLQRAVHQHFRVEELVIGAGVDAMGLHANAVIAAASRRRIQRDLEVLHLLPWSQGRQLAEYAHRELESHFLEEESRSYRPLARKLCDEANDTLARRCEEIMEGAVQ